MKTCLLSCSLLAVVLASPALAEEGFGWTGPYIGVQGSAESLSQAIEGVPFLAPATGTVSGSTLSASGGIDAGYNFQNGGMVYGFEVDANLIANNTINMQAKDTYAAQTDWYGSARGRIGVAHENAMVYVTGGLALADMKVYDASSNAAIIDGLVPGVVGGAGFEVAVSQQVSLKSEFLHFEYAKQNGAQGQDNVVRLGVNFHF
ncbi:MAG: porin family protein [Alphaproteobacteria bacterium]|nr:porin family protein [Alphaproteobacteria bacterium]